MFTLLYGPGPRGGKALAMRQRVAIARGLGMRVLVVGNWKLDTSVERAA